MFYLLGGLFIIIILWVFFRHLFFGRIYGNRIAKFIGMPKNLFHTIYDSGTNDTSLIILAGMRSGGISEKDAIKIIIPTMEQGIVKLRQRFGDVPQLIEAEKIIQKAINEYF